MSPKELSPGSSLYCFVSLVFALLASQGSAQWVTFQDLTASRSSVAPALFSTDPHEKDYGVGDFDQDGDDDLVVVRRQASLSAVGLANVLLMNEGGVLTDRTMLFGSASNVAGSTGLMDATNDRDVAVADVDGDGWLDLITCVNLGGINAPKFMNHPRIYINRGDDPMGNWLGFVFDDENRAPTMPAEPRFCAVSTGDIEGDGDLDIFFSDYHNANYVRQSDLDDRLWVNDGNGYFTDETATRMAIGSNTSYFGAMSMFIDVNNDGLLDIVRHDAPSIFVVYNDPANPGNFGNLQTAATGSIYNFSIGDLNNDNLADIVTSDDLQDRYQLGMGVVGGQLQWSASVALSYSGGGADDGFAGTNKQADLDNDGFDDVIIANEDVVALSCVNRCHIFRNLGDVPNVTLQEQQQSGAIAGIPTSQLTGTFDVAPMDINGDGFKDLVIGRCTGTRVWMNQPLIGLAFSYPVGLPYFIAPGMPHSFQVQITSTGVTTVNAATAMLHVSIANGPFTPIPLISLGGNLFQATIPPLACGQIARYYISCQESLGTTFSDPAVVPANVFESIGASALTPLLTEDFESGAPGWTVVNSPTLTGGAWELVVPNGVLLGTTQVVPGTDADASPQATKCFVTQNAPNPGTGLPFLNMYDVDGGETDLVSPVFSLAGTDGIVSFSRWYWGTSAIDGLRISISNDGGSSWSQVSSVASGQNANAWSVQSFRVGDYIAPTANMRVRFRCEDVGVDSVCESSIDSFRVEHYVCTTCQPTVGLQGPGQTTLVVCGGNLTAGTTATLTYAGGDPFGVAYVIADAILAPTSFGMGLAISPAPPVILPVSLDAQGSWTMPNIPGGIGPLVIYVQGVRVANVPGFIDFSNGIAINWP